MKIGIPKEIKPGEGRVALLPEQVARLCQGGHQVLVQTGAGRDSGAGDGDYRAAGAAIVGQAAELFADAELIVKVKEIMPAEFGLLRPEHILFTNLHGAGDREELDCLLRVGLTAIAAEDTHQFGSTNSPIAGEIGALEGLRLTLSPHGGTGRHFMAHYGAPATRALVIGLGGAGRGALRTLLGLGCSVVGLEIDPRARLEAELTWHAADFATAGIDSLRQHLPDADVVFNCVLWDKQRGDHLLSRDMLGQMKPTAVIVDISCDSAGAIQTSRPTTWEDPVYVVDGIRHFCVDNIPGAAPVCASAGYAGLLLPMVEAIAALGPLEACRRDPWLARGLTCAQGVLTHAEAAKVQGRDYVPVAEFLARQ